MPAPDVIHVRREREILAVYPAGLLRASLRERVLHDDRSRLRIGPRSEVHPRHREPCIDEHPASDRSGLERAKRVAVVVLREGTLRKIVVADAEVGSLVVVLRIPELEGLVPRERVIHQSADVDVVEVLARVQDVEARLVRKRDAQVWRRVLVRPLTPSEKLLFSLTIAPPTLNPKPLSCSGPFVSGERALRAHRSVAERQVRGSANRPDPWLCDDVDERGSRLLGLGGESIARHVHGFDLRFWRELLPFEAVDSNDGVRAGHVGDLLRHFRRVVRQRLDLFLRGRQSECLARAIGGQPPARLWRR